MKEGGVREYIESMTKAVIRNLSPTDELYIFHNNTRKYFESVEKTNVREIRLKSKNRIICDFLLFPNLVEKYQLDIVWFPKNVIPFFVKSKTIVTIHDLAYCLPAYNAYPFIDTQYMTHMIKRSCKRADTVISVSANTKKDLMAIFGISAHKIKIIHEAVSPEKYQTIRDNKQLEVIRNKYHLGKKIILYTGSISPRKNIARLIEAFNTISDRIPHDLIITGKKGWKNKTELSMIDMNQRVKKIGFVPDDEIAFVYNLSDMFVYPSLYEGFGLPVLEAQACGVPVIASNVTSIPEIGGDSLCYIEPTSIKSIADAILKVAIDRQYRAALVQKGFENVKHYSWAKGAKALMKVCQETVSGA